MSKDKQRLIDYLKHILQAITRIESYVEGMDEVNFLENELVQDAVIRNLEVVGEASRNIKKHYPDYVKQYAELPLSSAYEMRNALAHGYFKVDFEIVWKTIERDLPELQVMVKSLVSALEMTPVNLRG